MSKDVIDKGGQFSMVPFPVIEAVKDAKALGLYVILKKYANQHTKTAHPSRKRLAGDMGYKTAKAVDEALEVLGRLGLVQTFPRYKDEDGNIGHERDDKFREQTSNGYVIYDIPAPQRPAEQPLPPTPEGTTPTPGGIDPLPPEGPTPYPYRGYELYPLELDPRELDQKTPLTPQGEAGGPQQQALVVDPSAEPPAEPKPKKATPRAELLPEGWHPDRAVVEKLHGEFPHLDLAAEHEGFTDYWNSVPASKGRKRDWNATWRIWMRKQGQQRRGNIQNRPQNVASRADEKAMGYFAVADELRRQAGAQDMFGGGPRAVGR